MKDFENLMNSKIPCLNQDIKKVKKGSRGVYIYPPSIKKSKDEICYNLDIIKKEKKNQIIHEDSLTAWCNQAAEQYGLEIRDILKMKKGDKLKVILMDRNIGDYLHGTQKGKKIDPRNTGLNYGIYTHDKDLSGTMKFFDSGKNMINDENNFLEREFEWEINDPEKKIFWRPIKLNLKESINKGHLNFDLKKLVPKTKVGWRGPAIDFNDSKYLPKKITHYDTWWDDYSPFRTHDFIKIKRLKKD